MIKLERPGPPGRLTSEYVAKKTAEYEADPKKRVWDAKFIRDSLLAMSDAKCAYCETMLAIDSRYMEVEHYQCKSKHPSKVVEWSNLLPSCKRCNGMKGKHDVKVDGAIVDPTTDIPKDHIEMRPNYRFKGKTDKGNLAIETIYLNDSERLVRRRFDVGNRLHDALAVVRLRAELLTLNGCSPKANEINSVIGSIDALLKEAAIDAEFSACAAYCIVTNDDYNAIRDSLRQAGLWRDYLEEKHDRALLSALF